MGATNGWQEIALQDLATEITVGFVGPMASEYVPKGIPFLRSLNVEPYRINRAELMHVSESFHQRIKKSALAPGDVVIVRTGKPGTAAVIPDTLAIANCSDLVIVRPGPQLDARFLAYYINSAAQGHVFAHTVGAVQQHFNVGSAKTLKLLRPPLHEQRAIARILGALDDKIELNRRMNRTLEAMAQALFRAWFVDFEPVSAKREGRRPVGMDDVAAALFPEHFRETAIGPIPAGWDISTIGMIADVIDCLHSRKPDRLPSGKPLLQLGNIRDDGLLDPSDWYLISEDDYDEWVSRMEAQQGDCVITNVGRVGAVSQIPPGVKAALGRNMTGIRCKISHPLPTFLIECLLSDAMRDEIVQKTDAGTILDALNVKNIPSLRFVSPPGLILDIFEKRIRPVRAKMEHNFKASLTLGNLRDHLLPQLLSGKLRIGQAERIVGEA